MMMVRRALVLNSLLSDSKVSLLIRKQTSWPRMHGEYCSINTEHEQKQKYWM